MAEAKERARERFEILADIIEFLIRTGPQMQTHIMQACNLKHEQVVDCLRILEESQLIIRIEDGQVERYQATPKGTEFFGRWVEMLHEYLFALPRRRRYFWQK